MMGIIAPPGTPGDVVKLASDLSSLLGAAPFFLEAAENDSLMAAVQLLPQLMAAALLDATAGLPGWAESRKLAGRSYAGVSGALLSGGQIANLSEAALNNSANAVRMLDAAMQSMQALREALASGDEAALSRLMDHLVDARLTWWREREKSDWSTEPAPEIPSSSQSFRQMIIGNWGKREKGTKK
jgi:prephenate dehydrogenase